MEETPDSLDIEVREFINQRRAVNRMLLGQIQDTYELKEFTGNPTPGVSKKSFEHPVTEPSSCPLVADTPESVHHHDGNDSDSDSNDKPDDAFLGDLG
ncbi:hypothetical protein C0992_012586, partial [Termitomyces sp. T32_za158]